MLVWGPIAVYFILVGAVLKGLGLIVFGTVVIGVIDNFLRPLLVGKDTQLPDYVVLISTLGGIALFGFNGFVVGPVVAGLLSQRGNSSRRHKQSSRSEGQRGPNSATTSGVSGNDPNPARVAFPTAGAGPSG